MVSFSMGENTRVETRSVVDLHRGMLTGRDRSRFGNNFRSRGVQAETWPGGPRQGVVGCVACPRCSVTFKIRVPS